MYFSTYENHKEFRKIISSTGKDNLLNINLITTISNHLSCDKPRTSIYLNLNLTLWFETSWVTITLFNKILLNSTSTAKIILLTSTLYSNVPLKRRPFPNAL